MCFASEDEEGEEENGLRREGWVEMREEMRRRVWDRAVRASMVVRM